MLPTDHNASPPDFNRTAVRALEDGLFAAPAIGEAHVVLCDSSAWTSLVGSAQELLSPAEGARAARLRFDRDRSSFILAHAFWRVSLGICLDVHAAEVRLTSTAAGQPQLLGTAFSTSLSHSGEWVALAICAGTTIGVDIERSPSHTALTALMPTICTPGEIADLEPLPLPQREAALLALWTRKEALLKAFGVGLNVDPALLSATTDGLVSPPSSFTTLDPVPCRVSNLGLPDGLVGALAVPDSIESVRLCTLGTSPAIAAHFMRLTSHKTYSTIDKHN
ncbi:4'-phosphopantetheinyl transferase family protein [Rhodanobacter sp. Col0626]|uniref:4'-phosphopantetheinyl transferase family protein n=1 Tax=Rhodanobacter sp. Col0626 TaxID=3415679 RepID=UPI003CFB2C0D